MASIRHLIFSAAFILQIVTTAVSATDLIKGNRVPGDGVVTSDEIALPGQVCRIVYAQKTFTVPRPDVQSITMVAAIDRGSMNYKRRGYAEIIDGGVGHKHVTIKVWSFAGNPVSYMVAVYGTPYP